MKSDFPYPLQVGTLEEFTHPAEAHAYHHPLPAGTVTYAANGYVALRCHSGMWTASDFPVPAADALARLQALPWHVFDKVDDQCEWRPLDDIKPLLLRYGSIHPWMKGRPAPSPVVMVAEKWRIRLSHLQLISRLPKAEILIGPAYHIAFRFSGGTGLVPWDEKISGMYGFSPFALPYSFAVLSPPKAQYDGVVIPRRKKPPIPLQWSGMKEWPPPTPID